MAFEFDVRDDQGRISTVVSTSAANAVRKANGIFGPRYTVASPMRDTSAVPARKPLDSRTEFAAALWEGHS